MIENPDKQDIALAAYRSIMSRREFMPTTSLVMLVVLVTGCLYWAKPVLVPVALAVLITFVHSPVIATLERRGMPRLPAVIAVVGATVCLIVALGWMLISQFVHFANRLPSYQDNVTRRIAELREEGKVSLLGKVQDFVEQVSAAATNPLEPAERDPDSPQPVRVVGTSLFLSLAPIASNAGQMAELLASLGLVTVLVVLMLLHREDIRNRIIRLFGEGRMTLTTKALDDAAKRISRYLLAQFIVNCAFGLIFGCGLWLLEVPYALLWGSCAAVLRYIPFLGSWLAMTFPLVLSLLTATGWAQPLGVVALFVGFEICVNLLVEPWLYGQRIGVSQAGLLVAIAFWAWLWGAPGLVLAPPLTVCLVVLGKYVPALKFFDIILGDAPALTPETKFYQRLLVRDQDEAAEVIREELKHHSSEQVVDRVLIPALVGAGLDLDAARLSETEFELMMQAIRDIAEEQDFGRPGLEPGIVNASEDDDTISRGKFTVLACPAREGIDETALALFCRFVDPKVCRVESVSAQHLASEIVVRVADETPSIVCIIALPEGGLGQTRLLCKRLRTRFAGLKIVVGRWGMTSAADREREQLRTAGTEYVGTTMHDTMSQLVQLVQLVRAPSKREIESSIEPAELVREAQPAGIMPNPIGKVSIMDRSTSWTFSRLARWAARLAGHPAAFTLAVCLMLLWLATGPIFGFSDTWQLVINTATTIITFLMVFLIQNSQNRDTLAIHLKLDELVRAIRAAQNSMLDLDELDEKELDALLVKYQRLGHEAQAKAVAAIEQAAKMQRKST